MQQGVFCLQRLDVLVSRSGASKGARDWINNNLREYAGKYGNVKFNIIFSKDAYINPRLTGHYANGRVQQIITRNKTPEQISMLVKRLHDRNGNIVAMKRWPSAQTSVKSFQGQWTQELTRNLPHCTV